MVFLRALLLVTITTFLHNNVKGRVMTSCGGIVTDDVTSIKYPAEGTYPNNVVCRWTFIGNHSIKFSFSSFRIEEHDTCSYDYLKIGTTLKRCGTRWKMRKGGIFNVTPDRPIKMTFKSDADVSRTGFLSFCVFTFFFCSLIHYNNFDNNASTPFRPIF